MQAVGGRWLVFIRYICAVAVISYLVLVFWLYLSGSVVDEWAAGCDFCLSGCIDVGNRETDDHT